MKIRGQKILDPKERIKNLSIEDKNTGCWNWIGTKNGNTQIKSYGKLTIGSRTNGTRKNVSAHRYSYQIFIGEIDDGLYVCHKCDNPSCVNPEHLFLGTRQDNVNDRESKGRNKPNLGEKNPISKLTEVDIISAKRLRAKGETFQSIANRFGVNKTTIIRAVNGTHWKHISAAPKE